MFPEETRKRQEMLADEIYILSKAVLDPEKNEHLRIINKLQMIYKDDFRHSYSDFFPVVSEIFGNGAMSANVPTDSASSANNEYVVEYLINNLELLRTTLERDYSDGTGQFKDIYSQFTKLCDHLNLLISEMIFFSSTETKVNDARIQMQQSKEELKKAYDALEDSSSRTKSLQTELIAVLSIFAAIITAFSGGFTFLGSVMVSIESAIYYEMVILSALVCGIVMFNTIFLMMYLVGKITNRNIYARCATLECSCSKRCNGLKRVAKRLPYVFYFNLFCVLGIITDCVVWYMDIHGFLY